jgi:hypothetical protein
MTTRREMLIKGINKFTSYVETTFPNTSLANDVNKMKHLPIETITLWLSENVCKPSFDQVFKSLVLQSGLPVNKIDSVRLSNFITYFREVLC